MESTSSVSKGIFVFKKQRASKRGEKQSSYQPKHVEWFDKPWYQAYKKTWQSLEQQMEELYRDMFAKLLSNVCSYLDKEIKVLNTTEIPTATILTGINVPDHSVLFSALEERLQSEVTPHVALLSARSCPKVRSLVGHVLRQCQDKASSASRQGAGGVARDEGSEEEEEQERGPRRATQCTFSSLVEWYAAQPDKKPLVVVLTDFESFIPQVVEDFIYIASEYQKQLPLVLVLGVATTESAVHSSLPHRVMSRLKMQVFITQNSNALLNQLLNKVILSPKCHFRVGGNVFRMLSDNFLFYDFSVQSFLQKFKFCMLEHFSGKAVTLVCAEKGEVASAVEGMSPHALDLVRKIISFRKFVEKNNPEEKQLLLINDVYLKSVLVKKMESFLEHFDLFLVGLRCLNEMSTGLPGSPIGKHLGDLYLRAVSECIWESSEYAECKELWKNLSKTDLDTQLKNVISILNESSSPLLQPWSSRLRSARKKLNNLEHEKEECPSPSKSSRTHGITGDMSRLQMQERLRENAMNSPTTLNRYEALRIDILAQLQNMLTSSSQELSTCLLFPPGLMTFHELLMFDDLASVKNQLIGASRAALNNALKNPQHYLKCKCCLLEDRDEIVPSMPDVCVAYKLHLESGKHINLYDWLQSFHTVVNPRAEGEEEAPEIDIETQSRFTQAVAELQFLGFIKPTSRKADHVMRLTWGNS